MPRPDLGQAERPPSGAAPPRAAEGADGRVLGRLGSLSVSLAGTADEVARAQRLRFEVFHRERTAGDPTDGSDRDAFDAACDHLLVRDHAAAEPRGGGPPVVGTARLLRGEVAGRHHGFYSAGEYDLAPLLARHPGARLLELGRACVLRPYRDRRTVELLWHGIWAYVLRHRIDALFGCASLEGTDPDRLALPLSFLHHHAPAPEAWRVRALGRHRVPMDLLPREALDRRAALRALPPLVKGYLRLGAGFGDGAVVDHRFGTTDVFVVLPVSAINPRYVSHFGPEAGRHAAVPPVHGPSPAARSARSASR